MFQITPEMIIERSSQGSYKKGGEYYRAGRIKAVQFNQEKLSFDAKIMGTRKYDVALHFDANGELTDAGCSCPAYASSPGYCKHIVAVLLLIEEKDRQGFFKELKFRQAARHIFSFFQNRPVVVKTPVELEATFEYNRESRQADSIYPSLSLRMGLEKLYIVKNIKSLLESIEKNIEIQFGSKFAFDPARHGFKPQDRPLIAFLKELYENEKLLGNLSYGYTRASMFKGKQVFLSNSGVSRFFEIFKDRRFTAVINSHVYEDMVIRQEDIPVEFSLSKDGNDLLLNIDFEGSLIPLTEDGEYFFAGGKIYKTTPGQQENFKPFYMSMLYQKGRKLRFIEEDKERFVSQILPFAEKAGNLTIDEKVQTMIERVELDVQVYLDRSGSAITAEVKFVYGERVINPFAPAEKASVQPGKILLRNVQKEEAILDILAQSDFKVKDNRIHLNEEDNVFDFVFNIIPRLQEHASVYYSESFKNLTVRSSFSFSGKMRLNARTDMLEFSFSMDGIDRSELADILASLKERKKYYQLKNGNFLNLDSREVREVSDFLNYLDLDRDDPGKNFVEIPKYKALYLDQSIRELGLHSIERNHAFKEFVQNIREPEDMEFKLPEGLMASLREYQKFGFKWLKTLSAYSLGGILADDMGLGKTLQVITLILSEKQVPGTGPSLIVVPTSLVYNWCAEIERFAPQLKYVAITGNKEERQQQMQLMEGADVVITSYPLIRRDIDEYENRSFRYCILDEAQHIKNPGSQNARSVKKINADRRFALTGTPMENNLTELWSIFDFVLPGYLDSHKIFVEKYEVPAAKEEGPEVLRELGKQIRPFILRRLKEDVLSELPEKIEHRVIAELSGEQKKLYMAYLSQVRGEIQKEIEENGFEKSQIKILSALTRLRQICCHPRLFLEDFTGQSGKMELLQEIIRDSFEGGHRILLFSQFTGMLHLIRDWLEAEKTEYAYLDGSTPAEERGSLVKAFNEGHGKVFLISLKAGGTGLNLTGADTVIHYDPWWNPAVEEQATDRAYRIGQKKSVHVMKLVTKGTLEEKIYDLQERKRELIDAVIQPGETLLTKLSREEIQGLFE